MLWCWGGGGEGGRGRGGGGRGIQYYDYRVITIEVLMDTFIVDLAKYRVLSLDGEIRHDKYNRDYYHYCDIYIYVVLSCGVVILW